jgi:hypothetical protein
MFDMFSTKKTRSFPGHEITEPQAILQASTSRTRRFPTSMWNRKVEPRCVGSLPSCLGPLQGVYENRWEQGFRQDDPLVRLEVVGRVGSFAPCCPGPAARPTATCPYPMVAQEPTHPRPRRGGDD